MFLSLGQGYAVTAWCMIGNLEDDNILINTHIGDEQKLVIIHEILFYPWSSPHSISGISGRSGKIFKQGGKSGISRYSAFSGFSGYSG